MDPVSILSLAATIVTFVDVGFKVVHHYDDLRRNGLAETRNNSAHRAITQKLKKISDELTADGPPFLTDLGRECSILCTELIELLDKLKMKNPGSRIERILVIFKILLSPPDISSLEDKLDMYRKQLMVSLLKTVRYEDTLLPRGEKTTAKS